jgi:ATP-dependent DNA helicase RecG
MVRFNGVDRRAIIDQLTITSSIFNLLNEFELFFNRNTKKGTFIKGIKSYDVPEYPIEAVREAFVNAIAHRDYSLTEDCITFYIYDDRILVSSPGGLPYPLTVEDLRMEVSPKHRNKTICRIFKYTPFMEHFGTGITRMRGEMLDSGLPSPEFYDTNYFKVILRGPNGKLIVTERHLKEDGLDLTGYDLNKRQLEAVTLMYNEGIKFTYKRYAEHFGVSLTTSKRDLQFLVEEELVSKNNVDGVMTFSSNGL